MLKRIGSAMIGVAILFGVYFSKNDVIFNIAVVLVSILGINEFYNAMRKKGAKPVELIGYICCIFLGFVGFVDNEKVLVPSIFLLMPIILFILSIIYVLSDLRIKLTDVAITILGIIYVPLMMMFMILTWQKNCLYTWYIFGGAWLTDTFAYFIGVAIGKHKFSRISPNKSIEGCIAGLIGGALFFGCYTYFLNTYRTAEISGIELNIALMTFFGAIISLISQVGDFTASAIKRQCEIKDFGSIMPGHGGVLDRFDSILMISPFVFILFEFFIK